VDALSVEEMYGEWPVSPERVEAALNRSLHPRGSSSLFDNIASLGLAPGAKALDIGARDARYSLTLAERFEFDVLAVDPVGRHLEEARSLIAASPESARIVLKQGVIEQIPADSESFDLVFCRDVLSHVDDLEAALDECFRVLAPAGRMVVYQTFATSLMEPGEAARLYPDLAVVPASMDPARLEAGAVGAGFTIEDIDVISSEWREAWEEDGTLRTSRALLHAARLLRGRERLESEIGEVAYRVELANALWGVYQMIGKLEPRVYTLGKRATTTR
jgi:SAM-dependent methyltransferase